MSRATRHAELVAEWGRLQERWPELKSYALNVNTRMTSAFGRCDYRPKVVHVAAWHVERSEWDDVLDTLRHEAAHVLAKGDGHGAEWKRFCVLLGAKAERCGTDAAWQRSPAAVRGPKWIGRCGCGRSWERARLTSRMRYATCGRCRESVRWDERA